MEDGNPAAAEKIRAVLDKVMNRPSSASLQFLTPGCQDRWSWSDALFMSPPVFVKLAAYTGDRRYLEFMDREYKLTCDYLFDREEGLFFRDSRYFTVPAANGKKMFWSRGNGWVIHIQSVKNSAFETLLPSVSLPCRWIADCLSAVMLRIVEFQDCQMVIISYPFLFFRFFHNQNSPIMFSFRFFC